MRAHLPIAFAIVFAAPSVLAQEGARIGEPCRAQSECQEGFRCLQNACVDEATFKSGPGHDASDEPVRPFLGITAGAGLPTIWQNAGEIFQLAIRGGFMFKGLQVQFEISPASAVTGITSAAFGMADATAMIGYLIPMNDLASWVLRFGGGGGLLYGLPAPPMFGGGPPLTQDTVGFGEVRVDVVGVSIRPSKHLLVEFMAPSYRIMILGTNGNNVMMTWVTSLSFGYLF